MTNLVHFRKFAVNASVISLFMLSSVAIAATEQCNQVSKILKANVNGYTELVDTKRFNLRETPFSQSGRENVESTLVLPSAERCQATWIPEKEEFVYMCDWINENNNLSWTNLKVIGDIVEKCLVESKFQYDRVNPKKDENLSFITFYFSKESNLKIVLMKFGSTIKSRFEFAKNQLPKPGSKISENNLYDRNAVWPASADQEELRLKNEASEKLAQEELRLKNEASEKLAQEEIKKQQAQAQLDKQKAEQLALQKQKQLEAKRKQEQQEAERLTAENKEIERVEKAAVAAVVPASPATSIKPATETKLEVQVPTVAVVDNSQTQALQLETNSAQNVAILDPSQTACWYFASYTSMYQEERSPSSGAFSAALVSNINSIAVNWTADLEKSMRQELSQKAAQAWESGKPSATYFYYNSQPFGHINCGEDAKQNIELIRKTMNTADWLGQFEAKLD